MKTLPASATVIPVAANSPTYPDSYRLFTAAGTEVPMKKGYSKDEVGTPLLNFLSPLDPGDYLLGYPESCPDGVPAKDVTSVKSPLKVVAAPTPVTTGTFTVENRAIKDGQHWTYSGGCYVTMKYVELDVVFHASPELEPFKDASGYTMTIDGRTYNSAAPPIPSGSSPTSRLHAACDGDDRQTGGLSLGTHTVSVTWHLAGATSDLPTATTTVDLGCGADTNPPSSSSPSSSSSSSSSSDGGTAAPNALAPGATDDTGGCSTTGKTPLSAMLFALVGLAAVRKSRSRRR